MEVNLFLSAPGNLLELIIDSNPGFTAITEAMLAVQSVGSQSAVAGHDSTVVVSATGYTDTASFTYTRLNLADVLGQASVSASVASDAQAADIIKAAASAVGLVASELVLTNEADAVAGGATAVIDAAPDSLLYNPGAISVPLVRPPVAPSITSLVTTTVLSGFDAPVPAPAPATPTPPATPTTPGTPTTSATTPTDPASPATPATPTTAPTTPPTSATDPAATGTGSTSAGTSTVSTGGTPAASGSQPAV